MDHISRISLLLILAGLLFSPAEGVCLLPFHGPTAGDNSNRSLTKGQSRYQAAIKHFGNESGSDHANRSVSKSSGAKIGVTSDLKIDLPLGLVDLKPHRPAGALFYHGEHFCDLRSRPPPSFE
jgi:hypothetical protein